MAPGTPYARYSGARPVGGPHGYPVARDMPRQCIVTWNIERISRAECSIREHSHQNAYVFDTWIPTTLPPAAAGKTGSPDSCNPTLVAGRLRVMERSTDRVSPPARTGFGTGLRTKPSSDVDPGW